MKNSIITATIIAFVSIFATNNAQANTFLPTNPNISANKIKVTVTVNFGKRSQGCTGFGVCSIVISAELARASNNSGSGIAETKDGKLVVTLDKKSMTQEAIAKYFVGGKFRVEEDFQVGQEEFKKIEFENGYKSPRDAASGQATGRRQYTIKQGTYNVQDNGSTLTLVF